MCKSWVNIIPSHAGSLGVQSMLRDNPNIDYQISIRYERTFLHSHRTKIASKSVNSLLKRGLINLARKQQLTSHKLILHFYPPLHPPYIRWTTCLRWGDLGFFFFFTLFSLSLFGILCTKKALSTLCTEWH